MDRGAWQATSPWGIRVGQDWKDWAPTAYVSIDAKKSILRNLMFILDLRKNSVVGIQKYFIFSFHKCLFKKDTIYKHGLNC